MIEYSLGNLRLALDDLETRRASPPDWMSNPDALAVMGGEETSKQETWAIFINDEYPVRKSYLEELITARARKVEQYREVLELLGRDNHLAAHAIRKKYYDKVKPDQAIYSMFLFCSRETYFRAIRKGIRFYFEALRELWG